MNRPTVLLLCAANSARSQMAEALLREMAGDCYEAHSAGLEPQAVSRVAVQAMVEIGHRRAASQEGGRDQWARFLHLRDELVDSIAELIKQNCTDLGLSGRRFCGPGS